jgi:hypothetical protein
MKIRTRDTAEHIWSKDPALDIEADGFIAKWKDAIATGDPSRLPIREGRTPAVWKVRRLDRAVYQQVMRAQGLDIYVEAVAFGLVSVRGLEVDDMPVGIEHEDVDGNPRVRAKLLSKVWNPRLFEELAAAVFKVSSLDPTSGQG